MNETKTEKTVLCTECKTNQMREYTSIGWKSVRCADCAVKWLYRNGWVRKA